MIQKLVICIRNDNYPASLEKRKLYVVIPDKEAESHGHLRIIDESGEDYLYPSEYFVEITLPQNAEKAVIDACQ